jgi:hypothetical protein
MPSFTDALDVSVGDAILASHVDNLADNTEFNRELMDIGHDADVTTGDGYHKGEYSAGLVLKNDAEDRTAQLFLGTDGGVVALRVKTGTTYANSTPSSDSDGVQIAVGL